MDLPTAKSLTEQLEQIERLKEAITAAHVTPSTAPSKTLSFDAFVAILTKYRTVLEERELTTGITFDLFWIVCSDLERNANPKK